MFFFRLFICYEYVGVAKSTGTYYRSDTIRVLVVKWCLLHGGQHCLPINCYRGQPCLRGNMCSRPRPLCDTKYKIMPVISSPFRPHIRRRLMHRKRCVPAPPPRVGIQLSPPTPPSLHCFLWPLVNGCWEGLFHSFLFS